MQYILLFCRKILRFAQDDTSEDGFDGSLLIR